MKRLLLTLLTLMVLPLSMTVSAADVEGIFGVGTFKTGTDQGMAYFVGGKSSVVTVVRSNSGKIVYQTLIRSQLLYVDSPDDIQAASLWSMHKKSLGFLNLYAASGFGLEYQVKDADDQIDGGVKLELGYTLPSVVDVFLGYEHVPRADNDYKFAYLGIDLNL